MPRLIARSLLRITLDMMDIKGQCPTLNGSTADVLPASIAIVDSHDIDSKFSGAAWQVSDRKVISHSIYRNLLAQCNPCSSTSVTTGYVAVFASPFLVRLVVTSFLVYHCIGFDTDPMLEIPWNKHVDIAAL